MSADLREAATQLRQVDDESGGAPYDYDLAVADLLDAIAETAERIPETWVGPFPVLEAARSVAAAVLGES